MTLSLFMAILMAIISLVTGALLVYFYLQKTLHQLREENIRLQADLQHQKTLFSTQADAHEEQLKLFKENQAQLGHTFSSLSQTALKDNNEAFLKLAAEKLKQHNIEAEGQLAKKEQAIEHLVKPIKEALEKTQQQITSIEKERKESYGAINKHLEGMAQSQSLLQAETHNLVKSLRRPEVRGQWGEITLKRLVELAGMVEYCDFYEQEHTQTEDGAIRPDMIVRMPGDREIVLDVKTPLDAYLNAVEADNEQQRIDHLRHHARNVRARVRELSSKAYWEQFKKSPDFAILFIPGDHFLSAALDNDPALLEDALKQKVILATPSSLVALLRAIAFGWNQERITENAEKIKALGEDIYKRLSTFTGHLSKLGKNLDNSIEHYNKAVGSFERQVMPGARKFTEMGIAHGKTQPPLEPIEKTARRLEQDNNTP